MEKKRYRVTFSGRLVGDLSKKSILDNLAALFRKNPEQIRSAFYGAGAVIARCDTHEEAARYVDAILRAGAICEVKEQSIPSPGVPEGPAATPPSVSSDQKFAGPKTIEPEAGPTDITLAPLICSRTGAGNVGLVTNRPGRESIAYERIALICVFKSSDSQNEIKVLLFTHDDRRPLLTDAAAITFAEFPDVASLNLLSSLRNFLDYMRSKNPALVFDGGTARFMTGEAPCLFTGDTVSLVSDLARALAQ